MATFEGGPFREVDRITPRYICPLCYRTASFLAAGVCRRDGVPRVPLDHPQVREDLRAHVQRLLERRESRELGTIFCIGISLTLAICYFGWHLGPLRGKLFDEDKYHIHVGWIPQVISIGALLIVSALFIAIFRKRSAMVILDNRAYRGEHGDSATPPLAGGTDPADLSLPELLRWLNVRIEG